ncbi:hypothetical protein ACWOFR_04725 [Carnobacterium gallinarum]|uniref:hypothetical protein n=1 Tax=Carnobacterium gallinarum TaxID=2749 RepID=UPI00055889D1|nr:hypothetical protein [Carnobacterium gallinarum]
MNETWNKWYKEDIPDGPYELNKIIYDSEGLTLELINKKHKITAVFKDHVISFRTSDEGDRWKTIDEIIGTHEENIFENNLFYTVNNSKFSEWIEHDSFGSRSKSSFTHFVILTHNDITDVLTVGEPLVSIKELG